MGAPISSILIIIGITIGSVSGTVFIAFICLYLFRLSRNDRKLPPRFIYREEIVEIIEPESTTPRRLENGFSVREKKKKKEYKSREQKNILSEEFDVIPEDNIDTSDHIDEKAAICCGLISWFRPMSINGSEGNDKVPGEVAISNNLSVNNDECLSIIDVENNPEVVTNFDASITSSANMMNNNEITHDNSLASSNILDNSMGSVTSSKSSKRKQLTDDEILFRQKLKEKQVTWKSS
jgi:hypothetical protein